MMFRKRVSPKQVATTVKEGTTRGRLLLSKFSVKTFNLNNTSGRDRKHQPSKNSRIPRENEARSLLDVGTPNKHQVTTGKCIILSHHHPFEIEPTRSSEMRKHVRPSRLSPTNKDLECTKRKGFYYTDRSKQLQRCKETELISRNETSKIYHDKLSTSENQFVSISNIETHDNTQAEEGVHTQDLNKSNLYKDKTFAENFTLMSSSQHEPPFIFSSPPRSQIVTRSQIIANPPGAPRALFREKSDSHVPSLLNLRKQAHLSSIELDETSMEKESSDNDESSFAFPCRKLEF